MTALEHFEKLLDFETDCWDVHEDLKSGKPDYVILNVRSPEAYAAGHVPGAINLPTAESSSATSPHSLPAWPSWSTAAAPTATERIKRQSGSRASIEK
jgi:rhodanese-related sulfurtransferase